jgi:PAS domain S-box-containing protein
VVGKSLFEHYKDVPAITEAVRRALEGQPQHIEVEVNGFIWDASYIPVAGTSEKIERVYGTAIDITERRKAEEGLKKSEQKYQQLYDDAPDMFVSIDAQTAMILQCNQTLVTNLGYIKEELIGRSIFDVYHPDCMEDVHKAFESFVATGEVNDAQLLLKRKDGTKIDVSLSVTAIRDAQGNILYSNSVWRDIRERKQAEHALQKAHDELEMKVQERTDGYLKAYNELQLEILARKKTEEALRQREQGLVRMERLRAVGELSAGISHNLNNILTGILGPSELLKDMTEDPVGLQMAEIINSSARRASDLVQRLNLSVRDVAENVLESVPVNKVVREAVQAVRPRWKDEAEAKGLAIEVVTRLRDVPPIRGSVSGLHDLLTNLQFNAVDALPAGGTITIETQWVDEQVHLTFRDTGSGMAEETRRRVFEPFFTTKLDVGSGLGLSIGYNTVQHWGGISRSRARPEKAPPSPYICLHGQKALSRRKRR